MVDADEIRYVRSETGWIAYQVVGSGPVDVVVVRPALFPVDLMWDDPRWRVLDGLSSFSRHVWFDPRGTGASDPIDQADGRLVESWVDDVVAVIDAVGCERVVVLGLSAPAALLFAATHPERIESLVLVNPSARMSKADGYPEGVPDDVLHERVTEVRERFGTGWSLRRLTPSLQDDSRFSRWASRAERLNCRRVDVGWRLRNVYDADVRHVLSAIRVPTLIVHRGSDNEHYDTSTRYVADRIPASKCVELPGDDWWFFAGETKPLLDAIEEFVTGRVMVRDDNRVLATVMFTDVVGSTVQLAEQGDERWRTVLDKHDTVVRGEIDRFRGRAVNTMGDGVVATFDGPGRALRCAGAIREALDQLGLRVRIGLHTGEIELRGDDIGGIAVHIAQRIQALAEPGELLASSTVKDLVTGSGIAFTDRGSHALKGVPDEWRLFSPQPDGHEFA